MSMAEAVDRFVPDGATVAMGTCLEPLIPFAAGHEIIRQGKRDLTLIGPISDILFDELLGASPAMKEVYDLLERVAESESTVLVSGDSRVRANGQF